MSKDPKSKNDLAWEQIFAKYPILDAISKEGSFIITSDQIKEFREPRLMVKFDHLINLPQIFRKNNLSILPLTRKQYMISNFQTHAKFKNLNNDITEVALPEHIQSLCSTNIFSETTAINYAFASGILSDFLDEENLIPTVSGRMSSESFEFFIQNSNNSTISKVYVNKSQIEIDAAFEGIECLSLFEVKMNISDDFIIRQLYYPFRTWENRISKNIRLVLLVYSNSIFKIYEYKFDNPRCYNSIVLIKQKNYSIEDTEISLDTIIKIKDEIDIFNLPQIHFPQANNFNRLINLCELLFTHPMMQDEITNEYAFDIRQSIYYADAGIYLGLIKKSNTEHGPVYELTIKGKQIINLAYKSRQLELCRCILKDATFYHVFDMYLNSGVMPSKNQIVEIMRSNLSSFNYAERTLKRRSSSVKGWIKWIVSLPN